MNWFWVELARFYSIAEPLTDLPQNLPKRSDARGGLVLQSHELDVICIIKKSASDDAICQDMLWPRVMS